MISVSSYTGGKDIPMSRITRSWVESYEHFLQGRGVARNTSSFYMRILRAAYNRAARERQSGPRENPFAGVYTGIDRTVKRTIGMEGIARICAVERGGRAKHDPMTGLTMALAMDLFLFSFYSRGMCFIDMVHLKWSDVIGGRISYVRRKTGQRIDLKVEPCMRTIMERYRMKGSDYVFPIIDTDDQVEGYRRYRSGLSKYNRYLGRTGRRLGLSQHLTSYCSRHTWASACRDSGIPLSAISSALGHTSEKTTRIYLSQMDGAVLDRENERMLRKLKERCLSL